MCVHLLSASCKCSYISAIFNRNVWLKNYSIHSLLCLCYNSIQNFLIKASQNSRLLNSQLVVLNPVMLYLKYSFSKYLLIVKRFGSLRERRYIIVYYYYYYGSGKLNFWDAIFSKTRINNTKQQQVVLSSKVQVWLWRGRHRRKKNTRREKHTPKTTVALKLWKRKQHAGKQTLYFDGLGHIVSSQTSAMMEPSSAILEHETTNQR